MNVAKKLFAVLFLIAYGLFANNVLLKGSGDVLGQLAEAFPSSGLMLYQAGEAGLRDMPFRTELLEDHARLTLALGKTESGGLDVVATKEGAFVRGRSDSWTTHDLQQFAVGLYTLEQSLRERGSDAEILYIGAQSQIIAEYTEPIEAFPLPDQQALMETMLYYLRGYHIDSLDVQAALARSPLAPSEYVYKTGVLWTTPATFTAVRALVEKLNSQFGAGIDPDGTLFDPDNFTSTVYEDVFMGTMGMRAGEPFTGREDFTVIAPAYGTNLTYTASGAEDLSVSGTFDETLLNMENLRPLWPYAYSTYATYMDGGAYYMRVIANNDRPAAPRALFIHDASALPFAALLSLGLGEVHMYWPAQAPEERGFDLVAYVTEHDIDYVFFLSECNYYALEGLFSVLD